MEKPLTDEFYLSGVDNELTQGKRNTTALIILVTIAFALLGCSVFFYQGQRPEIVKLASFLLLGIAFTVALQRLIVAEFSLAGPMLTALLVQLVVTAFLLVTRRFNEAKMIQYPAAFLLPVIIAEAWRTFLAIPRRQPRIWYYTTAIPLSQPFLYFEKIPIRVKIVSPWQTSPVLAATAPAQQKLGTAFYYLAKDKAGDEIQFLQPDGRPCKWVFYTKEFGLKRRYLDPEESLYENQLAANVLVIAEQVS